MNTASLPHSSSDQDTYNGPDRLTPLPPEILLHIMSYVQPPGDARWDDKSDLKAINLVNNTLASAVKGQLFRFMTLKYSYDYDRKFKQWKVPRLFHLRETQPSFADIVKVYTRAVRLVILPIPEQEHTYHDIDEFYRPRHFHIWSEHLRLRLERRGTNAPCVYNPGPNVSTNLMVPPTSLRPAFQRFFGNAEGSNGETIEEEIDSVTGEDGATREVFASYIFRTMHTLFTHLTNLKHVVAGFMLRDRREHVMEDYDFVANYALAFATAVILKRMPTFMQSVRIQGYPVDYEQPDAFMHFSPDVSWFCVDYVAEQLRDHADQLKNLDLDIGCYNWDYFLLHAPRPGFERHAYYMNLLQKLPNLTSLRLSAVSINGDEDYTTFRIFPNRYLDGLNLPNLRKLILTNWNITRLALLMLPACFQALTSLQLENLTMVSDERKHKDTRSRIIKALKGGLVGSVWNMLSREGR